MKNCFYSLLNAFTAIQVLKKACINNSHYKQLNGAKRAASKSAAAEIENQRLEKIRKCCRGVIVKVQGWALNDYSVS